MKNVLLLLALFVISLGLSAQTGVEVTYLQKKNNKPNDPNSEFFGDDCYATLLADGSTSTYLFGQGGAGKAVEHGDDNRMKVTFNDQQGYVFHTDKAKQKLISRDLIQDQAFIVREPLPQLDWTLDFTETREIGGHTCHKATTDFRGRSYTAWFAPDIPLDAGPWKLQGLPGLILEAEDKKGVIRFVFAGLKQTDAGADKRNAAPRKGISIEFNEFFTLRDKKNKEFFDKIAAVPGLTIDLDKETSYFETQSY